LKIKLNDPKINTQPKFEHSFPDGFVLVIDTRENDALFKRPLKGLVVVRDTLSTGDYSVRGFERSMAIERKNLADLYGSLGNGRERFKKELERLKNYERKWIFVESTHQEALSYQEYSQMHPNSVRHSIVSIEIRLGIPFYFQPDRRQMERHLLDLFVKYYKVKREGL
jgi:ERCC4-type nuclease